MSASVFLMAALAAWGPRGCPPVGGLATAPVVRALPPTARYQWRPLHGSKTQLLYDRGRLAGGWDAATHIFRWYENGQWAAPTAPPWQPLAPATTEPSESAAAQGLSFEQLARQPVPNFGLDEKKVQQESEPHYRLNGAPVSREQAWNTLVETSALADDSAKQRLSVIGGTPAQRQQVLQDMRLAPELAPWKERLLVRDYGIGECAHDWQVTRYGFVTTGAPTIYLQAADGKVLYRQDDYGGGAPRLAEGLRKHDPNYKPDLDPGRPKPLVPQALPQELWGAPLWAWGVGAAMTLLLVFSGRTEE